MDADDRTERKYGIRSYDHSDYNNELYGNRNICRLQRIECICCHGESFTNCYS